MKKVILFLSLVCSLAGSAQIRFYPITVPTEYDYLKTKNLFGLPQDTFNIPAGGMKSLRWLSFKGDSTYYWNVAQQKWKLLTVNGGGSGGQVYAGWGLYNEDDSTFAVDTLLVATLYKVNLKVNNSDTSSMLGNYLNSVGYGLLRTGQAVRFDSATAASYFLRRKDSSFYATRSWTTANFAALSHSHIAADITDFTPAVRNLLSGGTGISYNSSTGVITWTGSGSGITDLNGLSAATQTFAVGTSGTDFAISSVGTQHTFNIPTASASNRGALSSADWTTFNSKVGTSRTISTGYGLSGGGDLSANRTLIVDSATLAGYFLRIKDSTTFYPYKSNPLGYLTSASISGKLNISDTAAMLQFYLNNIGYGLLRTGQTVRFDSATSLSGYVKFVSNLSPLFTAAITDHTLNFTGSNAGAYTFLGRASGSGAYSFISGMDSNWISMLHSEAYYNTKYGTGNGTVTNFSAGDLSPLFTTSEATTTTTPALTFAASNINQYEILGRKASGSGAYSFLAADSSLIQGLHSEAYYNTKYSSISFPNTTLKYLTGYNTFGSFNDSARAAISLTTTGTSGAATYNSSTGVVNIPNYGNGSTTWSGVFGGTNTPSGDHTIVNPVSVQYEFTGSTPQTFTLPSFASNGNRAIFFKNKSSAVDTVRRGGTDTVYTSSKVAYFTLAPGESAFVMSGLNYWNVYAGTGTNSGVNTGDQNLFSSIPVSGQTTVIANSTTTALTLVAGTGMTITTDNTAKSITFNTTANTDSLFGKQDNSATDDRTFNGHDDWLFTFDSIDVQMKRLGVLRFDLNNLGTQMFSADGTNDVSTSNNYSAINANNDLTYVRVYDDSIAFNQPAGDYSIYALPQRTDTTANKVMTWNSSTKKMGWGNWFGGGGGSGANALGTYIVQTATNAPANAQILASLGTGLVKNTTTTGVLSIASAGTDYEGPFTETLEEFTGSTSTTVTVSQTPKTNKVRTVFFNGIQIAPSNLSISGTGFTLTGLAYSRQTSDVITVKYSY